MVDVEHHKKVEKRFDEYIKYLETLNTKEEILTALEEHSFDSWFEDQEGKRKVSRPFTEDEHAFDIGFWMGLAGLLIAIPEIVKRRLKDFRYVPLWRRGKDETPYSYEFLTTEIEEDYPNWPVHENFFKRIAGKDRDFGFLFGKVDEKRNCVVIEAVLPTIELGEVLQKVEYARISNKKMKEDDLETVEELESLLKDLNAKVKTGKLGNSDELIYKIFQILTGESGRLMLTSNRLNLLKDRIPTLFKASAWGSIRKINFPKRTRYLREKFLGAYYYEKGLLKDAKTPDNFLKKMNKKRIKSLKEKCGIKTLPQFLFFRKRQFEKVDSIMNAGVSFFGDKNVDNLPIMVCLDKENGTARSMCIGYKKDEGIYKRIRNYTPD